MRDRWYSKVNKESSMKLSCLLFLFFASVAVNATESELPTKDLNNQVLSAYQTSGQASEHVTAEQLAELQKQVAILKERQEEARKALEEMDQE